MRSGRSRQRHLLAGSKECGRQRQHIQHSGRASAVLYSWYALNGISTTNPQNSLIVLRLQQQHAIKGPCLLLLVTGAAAAAGPGAGAGGLAG